jgi:hypothetical protein
VNTYIPLNITYANYLCINYYISLIYWRRNVKITCCELYCITKGKRLNFQRCLKERSNCNCKWIHKLLLLLISLQINTKYKPQHVPFIWYYPKVCRFRDATRYSFHQLDSHISVAKDSIKCLYINLSICSLIPLAPTRKCCCCWLDQRERKLTTTKMLSEFKKFLQILITNNNK